MLQEAAHDADHPDVFGGAPDPGHQAADAPDHQVDFTPAREASMSRSIILLSVRELILTPM